MISRKEMQDASRNVRSKCAGKIARRSVGAILIVEFDLSRKQVDGDYRGMVTIDGVLLKIARQTAKRAVE